MNKNSENKKEEELLEEHFKLFQNVLKMPEDEARKQAKDLIATAKYLIQKDGDDKLPEDFGNKLLEMEKTNEKTKNDFIIKRSEGVTDKDIIFWWNMNCLQRRLLMLFDDITKVFLYKKLIKEGKSQEEAMNRISKSLIIYGDSTDARFSGDDKPLPFELKERINLYMTNIAMNDPLNYKNMIEKFSSCNAFLREQIRRGNI